MLLQKIGIISMLAIGSIWDIRERKIPLWMLAADVLCGIFLLLRNREIDWQADWYQYVTGIWIGMAVLLFGRLSGCIGAADGIMISVIGGVMGYRKMIFMLMISLLMAAVGSLVLIVIKRAGRKTAIPFIPFMLAGYVIINI